MKRFIILGVIFFYLLASFYCCREVSNIKNNILISFSRNGLRFTNIISKSPVTIIAFNFFYFDKEKENYDVFLVGQEFTRRTLNINEIDISNDSGYLSNFETNTYYYYKLRTDNGNIEGSFIIIDTDNPVAEYEINYTKIESLRILQNNESAR